MDKAIRERLNNCTTVQEMLAELNKSYELDLKPGMITKIALINGLDKAITMLNPKRKQNV